MMYFGSIDVKGNPLLDWHEAVHGRRTPQSHPYSYDMHYLWRDFDKHDRPEGISSDYTDRMREWDPEKYKRAFEGTGWIDKLSRADAIKAAEIYYEGTRKCVGFAICANQSSGYPIGLIVTVPA